MTRITKVKVCILLDREKNTAGSILVLHAADPVLIPVALNESPNLLRNDT